MIGQYLSNTNENAAVSILLHVLSFFSTSCCYGGLVNYCILFQSFNVTDRDLDDFFGGPAFLAWARMGNLHG